MTRRIAVFCGSSRRAPAALLDAARQLGNEIASAGHVLIYGGGRTGLMGAVADAALAAGGRVEGVILRTFIEHGVHHEGLHELEVVGDMRQRKAGLDERADAFVVLAGGLGTLEEVCEILSFRKLGLHGRPLVFLNTDGFFEGLVSQIERGVAEDLDDPCVRDYFELTVDAGEAVRLCRR